MQSHSARGSAQDSDSVVLTRTGSQPEPESTCCLYVYKLPPCMYVASMYIYTYINKRI